MRMPSIPAHQSMKRQQSDSSYRQALETNDASGTMMVPDARSSTVYLTS